MTEMMPIQDLMNRIRWDAGFGASTFEIGYLDHLKGAIIRIPFRRIHWGRGNRFSFDFEDEEGETRSIPLHRIREVYRDGALIWSRPHQQSEKAR
jgi:uncharacterized protein (UPF0248 family)